MAGDELDPESSAGDEQTRPDGPPASNVFFKDVARVYGGVLVVVIIAAVVAQFVDLVAQMLYAIVALLFFLVPERLIERRGEDPADYGIHTGDLRQGVLWGLLATAVTLPFFLPGYWVWERYFLDREFEPDAGRYRQWSTDVQGEPRRWGEDAAGVWVWADRDILQVGIRNTGEPNNRVIIESPSPFTMDRRGTLFLKPIEPDPTGAATRWEVALTHSQSRGVVTIRGPDELTVTAQPVVAANPAWPVYVGPSAERVDDGAFHDERALWWLALWFATQFLLVALPEEVFYRGFLQTRLEQGFAARGISTTWLGFTPAIFWASILFGLGHLLVPVGGAILANRMAVFFPSLLFGWLRRRTGSVVASTIYHAFSNAMVLLAAVHFT